MFALSDLDDGPPARQASAGMTIETAGPGLIELTESIRRWMTSKRFANGLLTVFCQHTSASLTIQENADPDVRSDIMTALDFLAPRHGRYIHSCEGPDDMPAHIRTMLTGSSLSIPVLNGKPALGTWQGIYLIEHRDHAHQRQVIVHYVGN